MAKKDFESKTFNPRDFNKKTLGQVETKRKPIEQTETKKKPGQIDTMSIETKKSLLKRKI